MKDTKAVPSRADMGRSGQTKMCLHACVEGPTLQFSIHGDVREAAQHSHDLVILLLPQEPQHAASVRVLETHQVLQAPNFVLERGGQVTRWHLARQETLHFSSIQSMCA